jgi:hypothetical protein
MRRTSKIPTSSAEAFVRNELVTDAPSPRRRRGDANPRRLRVRSLDGGATELVRVIAFVWTAGDAIQPVLMVDREFLN